MFIEDINVIDLEVMSITFCSVYSSHVSTLITAPPTEKRNTRKFHRKKHHGADVNTTEL
ncbi:hypothetical protein McpSp1_05090 [Methanocorpusculaceae archaeon Sp1]|nr:hypothetical protein [Methanocorpusculaceae archaeon Sp1]